LGGYFLFLGYLREKRVNKTTTANPVGTGFYPVGSDFISDRTVTVGFRWHVKCHPTGDVETAAYKMSPYAFLWNGAANRLSPCRKIGNMDRTYPSRKYTRLKDKSLYSKTGNATHIIIGTHDKVPYFRDAESANAFCRILIEAAKQGGNPVYAYCIMPDHVHFLSAPSPERDLITLVKQIKGRFVSDCRKKGRTVRLQRGFYDHILRREEDVREAARYIIANPVRAGISRKMGEYPFAGSLEFNL